jgi:hypothetical protein
MGRRRTAQADDVFEIEVDGKIVTDCPSLKAAIKRLLQVPESVRADYLIVRVDRNGDEIARFDCEGNRLE